MKTESEIWERIADLEQALSDQRSENASVKTAPGAAVELALESNIDELCWVLGE